MWEKVPTYALPINNISDFCRCDDVPVHWIKSIHRLTAPQKFVSRKLAKRYPKFRALFDLRASGH